MENLICETVSYLHKGVLIQIKVLAIVHRQGEAIVSLFNQRFKTHSRRKLEKRWRKGAKGKLKNKNIID